MGSVGKSLISEILSSKYVCVKDFINCSLRFPHRPGVWQRRHRQQGRLHPHEQPRGRPRGRRRRPDRRLQRRLAGAGLDVFEVEPLPMDSELRTLPNVVLGAHNASNTREGVARASATAVDFLIEELAR